MHTRWFFIGVFLALYLIASIGIFFVFDFKSVTSPSTPTEELSAGVFVIPQRETLLRRYTPFPSSEFVFREGKTILYAPKAKYTDFPYIDINLKEKVLTLFENGEAKELHKVVAIGPPYFPTPKGTFSVLHKEEKHFASKEKVWMPWSMHIVGDVFIHGIPYYPNGKILKSKYSHGCIRVATEQQKELYQKVPLGTRVVVY